MNTKENKVEVVQYLCFTWRNIYFQLVYFVVKILVIIIFVFVFTKPVLILEWFGMQGEVAVM